MKTDIYETITATIIDAIETGCAKFKMPWNTGAVFPSNAHTQRRYRGVNVLMLWVQAAKSGYPGPLWATYQQWQELGAQVRKGEKSTPVIFWKFYGAERDKSDENDAETEADKKSWFARAYHVFNAAQVDHYSVPETATLPEALRINQAEMFFRGSGLAISESGSRAYYDVKADEIHIPPFATFKKADYFYSVLAHESVHASGHPSRLNRDLVNRFGSEAYAAEELIAELGGAFLAAELNLDTEPRFDHAPYVNNWLTVLKSDRRAIFTAASKAQQAVQWLLDAQAGQQVE